MLVILWALYRPFVLVSFDRRRAASLGVPVERTELALMVLLAVAVVVGFTVVGALLVLGLLIAPPAAAALLTKRLPAMMAVSAAIAAAAARSGCSSRGTSRSRRAPRSCSSRSPRSR